MSNAELVDVLTLVSNGRERGRQTDRDRQGDRARQSKRYTATIQVTTSLRWAAVCEPFSCFGKSQVQSDWADESLQPQGLYRVNSKPEFESHLERADTVSLAFSLSLCICIYLCNIVI